MPTVHIPSLLRGISAGRPEIEVSGRTLRQVIASLDAVCPGMQDRLLDDGALRPELSFAVDGEVTTLGLLQPVGEHSEVLILPAIGGG